MKPPGHRPFNIRRMFVLAVFLSASACSWTKPLEKEINFDEAKAMFSAARHSSARQKSPYEYFSAEIYLDKAKQEMEKGNNLRAMEYWSKAHHMAQIAYRNAKRYKKAQ